MRKLATLTGAAMLVLGLATAATAGVFGPTVIIECQGIKDGAGGFKVKNASNDQFGDGFLAHIEDRNTDVDNCTEAVARATQGLCAGGMHVTGAPGGHVIYSILPNLCSGDPGD